VRPIRSVRIGFTLFGVFWGVWSVAAADIERALRLGHRGFGLLFATALAVAGIGNAVGGPLSERHTPNRIYGAALLAWAAVIGLGAAMHDRAGLALAIVAIVALGGLVDVGLNVIATDALGDNPGALVRFHSRFNLGGALGAALVGAAIGWGVSWRWGWAGVAVVAVGLSADAWREAAPPSPQAEPPDGPPQLLGAIGLLRAEHLMPIAVAFTIGTMVEGGVELWGVLYLRTQLHSGLLVGAGSACLAYLVATLARVIFGPMAGRRGAVRGVAAGAGTAAVGLVVLVASTSPIASGAGLVMAAGGISLVWPLLVAHASVGRTRPAAVVGSVTAMGYLGLVIGPALVGTIGAAVGLRWGLLALAGGAGLVALIPAWSARRRAEVG
jgi:MFS family permease